MYCDGFDECGATFSLNVRFLVDNSEKFAERLRNAME